MSFFSGGVDSAFTFLKHREEISHLVFIRGFDFFAAGDANLPFSADDICDLAQIAYKLESAKDPISAFVKSMLSEAAREALARYLEAGSDPLTLEEALAADLEGIIAGPCIYQEPRFDGVRLRPETRKLLARARATEGFDLLNRMLLEDAYPLEIARKRGPAHRAAVERNTRLAQSFGKTLVPVATNHFPFGYRYNLSRNLSQGGALASVALLLGFPRVYVPSSYSYNQLFPLGSHPLTDPLYSTEGTQIVHDGCAARPVDKIREVAQDKLVLANLRVCFDDINTNCGRCQKCLRTMVPLMILKAENVPFAALPSMEVIRKMRITDAIERRFFMDNLDLARQSGDAELQAALRSCMERCERQELFKEADRVILGGLIRRICRGGAEATPGFRRISTTPFRP